MKAISWTWK